MPNKVDPIWFREKRTKMLSDEFKSKGWTHQVVLAVIDHEKDEASSYFFMKNEAGDVRLFVRCSDPEALYCNTDYPKMSPVDVRAYYHFLMKALTFYKEDYIKTVVE